MALGSSSFFLAGAFARSFSLLQRSRGTAGGRRQRRGRTGVPAAPGPSLCPSPSPSGHSHALVPQADHALHHRVLPRLLLLPLQRDAAAVSRARLPGVPPVSPRSPHPPVPPHHAATTTTSSSGASTQRHRVPPRRAGPAPPSLPGEAEPGAAAPEPEPSVTSAGRGLRHRGAARSGAGAVRLVPGGATGGWGPRSGCPRAAPLGPGLRRAPQGAPLRQRCFILTLSASGSKALEGVFGAWVVGAGEGEPGLAALRSLVCVPGLARTCGCWSHTDTAGSG